jgi:SAM-dependent methyltransferase
MLIEEAKWLESELGILGNNGLKKLLNVGSSTLHFRTQVQPYIESCVFAPLRKRQIQVVHLDLKKDEGVDINGDIRDPEFRRFLKSQNFDAVLCSNLLEHVPDPKDFAKAITDVINKGAKVIVTVPKRYPYHKDPIDTLFRPSTRDLCQILPGTELLVSTDVVSESSMLSSMIKYWKFGVLSMIRLLKFYDKEWKMYIQYAPNIPKKYVVSCVIVEKL